MWSWEAKNVEGRCIETGTFHASPSVLPGKLTISQKDPRQLQYDNGRWYLNFCDNAFRLFANEENRWKAYIDQADQAGFNRIRSWLAPSANSLFQPARKRLNLKVWDEIDKRLNYALQRHPEIQFEIILYGPEIEELKRLEEGEPSAHSALRYAIERFAALPNVHWSIANNLTEADPASEGALVMVGEILAGNDPWHSLITSGGNRFDPPILTSQIRLSFQ